MKSRCINICRPTIHHGWIRVVCLLLVSVIGGGCIGESRLLPLSQGTVVDEEHREQHLQELVGWWTTKADVGSAKLTQELRFYRQVVSVEVEGAPSGFVPYDILEAGEDWMKLLLVHPTHISTVTLRFQSEDSLWLEHYPNTLYQRSRTLPPLKAQKGGR